MWKFNNPVNILFGEGSLSTLGQQLNNRRYALVTYDNAHFAAVATEIKAQCPGCVTVLNQVAENPDLADLEAICAAFKPHQDEIEVLVALGGGSVIDTTKALAIAKGDSRIVANVLKQNAPVENPLPMVVIPTTTGTGSEVTSWATIWDKNSGCKYSLNDSALFPETAICDPALTLNLPVSLTIQTGLDALSHAMESIWNRNANPISLVYATEAIALIRTTLPKLVNEPGNLGLREKMMKGSLLAGLAFSNTKTSIAHNMSYTVTLETGLPHGIACSFTLPAVLCSFALSDCPTAQCLRQLFGDDLSAAAKELESWIHKLDVHTSPEHYGYSKEKWQHIVTDALVGERGKNFPGCSQQLMNQFI